LAQGSNQDTGPTSDEHALVFLSQVFRFPTMYGAPAGTYDPSSAPPVGFPGAGYDQYAGAAQPGYDQYTGAPQPGYDQYAGAPQPGYDQYTGAPQPGYAGSYAGGPAPGYDPSMGAYTGGHAPTGYDPAQLGAGAELAELEEKEKANHQKHQEKQEHQLAKMMKNQQHTQSDNETCASILCCWGFMNVLLWMAPLLGASWWTKVWHGLGIEKLTVMVGLFTMQVAIECRDTVDNSLCEAIKPYAKHDNGQWVIKDLQKHMCSEAKESCSAMQGMYYAGWSPEFLLPAAAILEVLAVLLLYFYWHGKPSSTLRNLSNKCSVMAPIVGLAGVSGWMMMSPFLSELPRLWAAGAGQKGLANGALFGLKESISLPMGWCAMLVLFNIVSSCVRFFIQFTLPHHTNESDEASRLMSDADKMYDDAA